MADNITLLNNETQAKILKSFLIGMHGIDFKKTYPKLFRGPYQFLNWFKGLNEISSNKYVPYSASYESLFKSYGASGTIQTPYFNESFDENNFSQRTKYELHFEPPEELKNNIRKAFIVKKCLQCVFMCFC